MIIPNELLDVIGVQPGAEVEIEIMGNMLLVTAPGASRTDIEAGLASLASKRKRAEVYRRLAE